MKKKKIYAKMNLIVSLLCCIGMLLPAPAVHAEGKYVPPAVIEYDKEEAQSALNELLAEREVMALVYLDVTQTLYAEAAYDSEALAQLPSGQTVFVRGVEVDDDLKEWVLAETYFEGESIFGYMPRKHLACADEYFLDWEEEYVPASAYEVTLYEGEDGGQSVYTDVEQFPLSYRESLNALKEEHPNWIFVPMFTGLKWEYVIDKELEGNRSLIYKTFPYYMRLECYDDGNWYYPTREALEYYVDPRNGLTQNRIFQFELLTYNETYHTQSGVEMFLNNTFMHSGSFAPGTQMTYSLIFWAIGKEQNVSPFHLASRVYQEQGSGTSPLISGTYPGYEGYYNYFNVKASGTTKEEIYRNGLAYAKSQNWDNAYQSIYGGSKLLAASYISKGQDTIYLQKYNVNPNSHYPLFSHQYMQNIVAPTSEGLSIMTMYNKVGSLENTFVFKIPVYTEMPQKAAPYPTASDTRLDGVEYKPVYSHEDYAKYNPDVAEVYGEDKVQLLTHFVNSGMAEGRQAKAEFNVYAYKALNPDVAQVYGDDWKSYYMHYIENGESEGRPIGGEAPPTTQYRGVDYAPVYDYTYYYENNPDVAASVGTDGNALIAHFVNSGMSEGRVASAFFDVNAYRYYNPDIASAYGEDWKAYYLHYMECGMTENRAAIDYSLVFDAQYYYDNNPDIAASMELDELTLLKHFLTCGMAEGRRANADFCLGDYKELNPDLAGAFGEDNEQYYLHYIVCGHAEGRPAVYVEPAPDYSLVFDARYYYDNNPDIAASMEFDEALLLEHFIACGMAEGRRAGADFDLAAYKELNPDVAAALGEDNAAYYLHYIACGYAEGRAAVYPTPDYSLVFEAEYYYENNPDIAEAFEFNETLLLEHFISCGMAEGRRACEGFDVQVYKEQNPDLAAIFEDDLVKYYEHYILCGHEEERVCV